MSESVLCFIRIPYATETVDAMEAAHPEVVEAIMAAAVKYMVRHRRAAVDDEVIEVDEYATREDYDAFMTEAAPALDRYSELLGGGVEEKVYRVTDDDNSWLPAAAAG